MLSHPVRGLAHPPSQRANERASPPVSEKSHLESNLSDSPLSHTKSLICAYSVVSAISRAISLLPAIMSAAAGSGSELDYLKSLVSQVCT